FSLPTVSFSSESLSSVRDSSSLPARLTGGACSPELRWFSPFETHPAPRPGRTSVRNILIATASLLLLAASSSAHAGRVVTIAGDGRTIFDGDGGSAARAAVSGP